MPSVSQPWKVTRSVTACASGLLRYSGNGTSICRK